MERPKLHILPPRPVAREALPSLIPITGNTPDFEAGGSVTFEYHGQSRTVPSEDISAVTERPFHNRHYSIYSLQNGVTLVYESSELRISVDYSS